MRDVLRPRTLPEALALRAEHPEAVPIAGGTDLMVDLNFDRRRPERLLDISRLPELATWRREDGRLFLGAGVTYASIVRDLSTLPPLAEAARTVGSPQIRNRGTVGGNLGTASPAGDALPVLAAYDAEVVLASARGRRTVPWTEFLVGPKRSALRPDELIVGARWRVARGPGSFSKVGPRNAMVIAVA
ncbi:MAG TPA: FAD binding domain-containing protein, partial [bacterium]|nr:FAD binding domain-containing protein [bacterium]